MVVERHHTVLSAVLSALLLVATAGATPTASRRLEGTVSDGSFTSGALGGVDHY